jgi:hypothetical protein
MKTTSKVLFAALAVGLASTSFAATPTNDQLRQELQALRAEVAAMRSQAGDSWLNERRTEEVKALIHDVLSDADTRASLAGDGMTAGHNGHFFLASADGGFLLKVGGQIQFRYIATFENSGSAHPESGNPDETDNEDQGFQTRRNKVWFAGHVTAGPKWEYQVVLATDRGDGNVFVEDVIIKTALSDSTKLHFGKAKLPFLREELLSSARQLAADRAAVTEYFTLNRAEQIGLEYKTDQFKVATALSDGSNSEFSDIGADTVEVSGTVRGEMLLAGEWSQGNDFAAWSGEPFGAQIGAAVHHQVNDGYNVTSSAAEADYTAWTVDGLVETEGLSVNAAIMGGHTDPDDDTVADRDMYGLLVQAGYMVIPDKLQPFVRFEWIDSDPSAAGADDGEAYIITGGANYFFKKHNAKATVDLMWIAQLDDDFDTNPFGANPASSGLGFSDGAAEDNLVLRAQFQLLW